jgi:hypothetical protein
MQTIESAGMASPRAPMRLDVVVMALLRRNCACASNADADSDRERELPPLDIKRIY